MNRAIITLAVVGCMATQLATTAELDPPWRGAPGSTFQEWRFDNNSNPAVPDLTTNVASAAQAEITLGAFAAGWQQQLPGLGGATGFWDLGSDGTVRLSALSSLAPAAGEYLYISLQVAQWYDGGIYSAIAEVEMPGAELLDRVQMESQGDTFGGWLVDRTLWRLPPDQAFEFIQIQGAQHGAVIDRILLETQTFAPVCPSNLVVNADPGRCSASNVVWAIALDGYFGASVTCSPPTGSDFPVGTTAVECELRDEFNRATPCSFTVTVEYNTKPFLSILPATNGTNAIILLWHGCQPDVLEWNSDVQDQAGWAPVEVTPQTSNDLRTVTLELEGHRRFYRVRRQ